MQITEIFAVVFVNHTADSFHNGVAQVSPLRGAKLFRQSCDYSGLVFLVHFPKPGVLAPTNRVSVGNIMDILNIGFAACAFADQADSTGTGIDPAVHFVVPDVDFRTGRSVWPLGVNQKLVIKVIAFVEPGSGGQKTPPVLGRVRDFFLGLLRQFRDVCEPSVCHCVLLSKMKNTQNRRTFGSGYIS